MIQSLGNLIHALRNELQQFGEMLASLDGPGLDPSARIPTQTEVLRLARRARHTCQRATAMALNLDPDSPIRTLIPLMSREYRPLLLALDHENEGLLESLRVRLGQNQSQMSHSLGVIQQLVESLSLDSSATGQITPGNPDAGPGR